MVGGLVPAHNQEFDDGVALSIAPTHRRMAVADLNHINAMGVVGSTRRLEPINRQEGAV